MASTAQIQALESGVAQLATRIDGIIRDAQTEDNTLRARLDMTMTTIENELSALAGRITHTETAVQGLTAADIGMIQSIVTALAGQDVPTIINQVATIGNALQLQEQNVQGLQAQSTTHQQHMGIIQGEPCSRRARACQQTMEIDHLDHSANQSLSIGAGRTLTN